MTYEGKVVILTGAGGGIASAMARKFASLGASLALLDIVEEPVKKLASQLALPADRVMTAAADVSDEDSVRRTVEKVREYFGRIDVLVNTAGIPGPSARVQDYSYADCRRVFEVNVFGTFLMMKYVLPVMQAQKKGAVLNIGSVSGMVGYPYESAYGASKAAIIHLTKNAASENGGNGVRINCLSPGWVNTAMMKTIVDSYVDVGIADTSENVTLGPMGRPGEPAEMAEVAAFLCSDEASYVNGSNWLADGGMTLG